MPLTRPDTLSSWSRPDIHEWDEGTPNRVIKRVGEEDSREETVRERGEAFSCLRPRKEEEREGEREREREGVKKRERKKER